jgi:hypothetical protein
VSGICLSICYSACLTLAAGLERLELTPRDEIVAIASDKFGTHVLCKAIAVDELEVCPRGYGSM